MAGAVLAQTTQTVALESISFQRSADVLVMLVLGGAGRLYGGIIGAIIFMVARDQFSGIAPQYWYFWIGILLISGGDVSAEWHPGWVVGSSSTLEAVPETVMTEIALSTRLLAKRFGSLVVASNIEINLPKGVRYALIGPNGAGKTTLINLITGMTAARRRPDLSRRRGHHGARAAGPRASRPRPHLPDQHVVPAPQRARSGDARRGGAARRRRKILEQYRRRIRKRSKKLTRY